MKQGRSTSAKVSVALLAGLIALLLLFPASGIQPIPPQCFSIFTYSVPCEDWVAPAAAAATGALAYLALLLKDRRS